MATISTVQRPHPGQARRAPRRASSRSAPGPEVEPARRPARRPGRRTSAGGPRAGPARRSSSWSGVGKRWVRPPDRVVHGVAVGRHQARRSWCGPRRSTPAGRGRPARRTRRRPPCGAPAGRAPSATRGARTGSRDSTRSTASGSASRSSSRRHRAMAVVRSATSASSRRQAMWSGAGVRATTPGPCARRRVRR